MEKWNDGILEHWNEVGKALDTALGSAIHG